MIIKKHRFYFTKINAIFSKIDEILKNKWQTRGTIVMFGDFDTIMIFAGCSLIIDGVCDIVEICVFSHKVREAKKRIIDETNIIDM